VRKFRKLTDEKLTESFRMKFNVWTFFCLTTSFRHTKIRRKNIKKIWRKKVQFVLFVIRNVQLLDMRKMSRHENSTKYPSICRFCR